MAKAFRLSERVDLVAAEDLFVAADGKTVVGAKDKRVAFVLARRGDVLDSATIKRLKLSKDTEIDGTAPDVAAVAPEEIESRSTRPEKVKATR